jgi:large subunit ribosomal protein L1
MPRPKKEESAKQKRLAERSASMGEPENIFDNAAIAEEALAESATPVQFTEEGGVEKPKKTPLPPKMRGKKHKAAQSHVEKNKKYTFDEAITVLKKASYSKFVGTLEVHVVLADKEVRGTLSLPNGTGKTVKLLALVPDAKIKEAQEAGADIVGGQEVADKIKSGALNAGKDFNAVIADPAVMPMLAQLAKILGPKGMMPNPKNGTVGPNVGQLVTNLKKGQLSFKAETTNTALVHLPAGKISIDKEKLIENLNTIVQHFGQNKIKRMHLSATMAPAVEVIVQ